MLRIAALLFLSLCIFGCSRVPKPVSHTFSSQQRLEAAEHWRELAATVVDGLKLTAGTLVYVAQDDKSTFGTAFSQFVRHEALLRGYPISPTPENAMEVTWGTQIVEHQGPRPHNAPFPGTSLLLAGLGLAGVHYYTHNDATWHDSLDTILILSGLAVEGVHAGSQWDTMSTTDTELIIGIVAKSNGLLQRNFIAVYYINRADKNQYWERKVPWEAPVILPSKELRVVSN
ncbi:hypothetical protein [Nitratidesulfovibrio vulgaris]|uniref:hypothetical protein n=1 Tax=Nitratidesulfovibrio vulgaris TaxID=881 RepID=UPI0001A8003E|nr:hypothetical protein [Nitratidesulfovibrio vulgaris]ADP85919.1 hypothetical protein Deval_0755 [Nitratidesulfovibrio vulgaris RCH1]